MRAALSVMMLAWLSTLAPARTIIQSFEVNWLDTDGGPAEFTFDPFDQQDGHRQLTGVTLSFVGELDLEFAVKNFSALELDADDWYYDGGANIIVAFSEKPGYEDGGPFFGLGGVFREGVTGKLSAGSGGTPFDAPVAGDIEVTATVGGLIESTVQSEEASFPYFLGTEPLRAKMSPFLDFVLTPPLADPAAFISAEVVEMTQRGTLTMTYQYDVGATRPEDCNLDRVVDAGDLQCVCGDQATGIDDVLSEIGIRPGDLDANGVVGFADFLVFADSFGGPGDYLHGDLDCSGLVDFQDFLIFSSNFDETDQVVVSVPESIGGLMLPVVLCALPRSRRKQVRATRLDGQARKLRALAR